MDGEQELGKDLQHIELRVGVPRAEGVGPLLLFNTGTGKPWHFGPRIAFGAEGAIVPVCEAPTVELEVLEKGTDRHLDSVTVVVDARGSESVAKRLASSEPSPLQLTPGAPESLTQSVKLRVEAAGYGTQPITIDFRDAGKRVIELERAGRLTVEVVGDIPADSKIGLHSSGTRRSRDLEDSTITFQDLTPGAYLVRLTLGSLAPVEGTVTVLEGERAELTLMIPDAPATQLATIRGTLVFPAGWRLWSKEMVAKQVTPGRQAAVVAMIHAGQMKPVPGKSDEFTFELENFPSGKSVFSLPSLQLDFPVEVPHGGLHDVRFVVPPPVQVTVFTRTVTGVAESEARVPELYWRTMLPGGEFSSSSKSVRASDGSHRFDLRVPAGTTQVHTSGIGWSSEPLEFAAVDGLELVLEVKPSVSFSVELRDGNRVLPWPPQGTVRLVASGGAEASAGNVGGVRLQVSTTTPRTYTVAEPGAYEIAVPKIDGYLPHDNVVVLLKRGPKQKVVVQLTPR